MTQVAIVTDQVAVAIPQAASVTTKVAAVVQEAFFFLLLK